MAVYLKSLATTDAPSDPGPLRTTERRAARLRIGAKVYDKHCKSCHGTNGLGVPPMYPPLADNRRSPWSTRQSDPHGAVRRLPAVDSGQSAAFGMPPFAYTLSDQEVADVVTYMRQSWGNRSSAVSPVDVAKYSTVPVD